MAVNDVSFRNVVMSIHGDLLSQESRSHGYGNIPFHSLPIKQNQNESAVSPPERTSDMHHYLQNGKNRQPDTATLRNPLKSSLSCSSIYQDSVGSRSERLQKLLELKLVPKPNGAPSRLESPFIENLRKKYPTACNSSLTKPSFRGGTASLSDLSNRQMPDQGLVDSKKPLSSHQSLEQKSSENSPKQPEPDALRPSHRQISYSLTSLSPGSEQTYMSGGRSINHSSLSEKLRLHRERQQLLTRNSPFNKQAMSHHIIEEEDEEDDTAPLGATKSLPIKRTYGANQSHDQNKSTADVSSALSPQVLSDPKAHLDELRSRLSEKFEALMRKKDEICSRVNSRSTVHSKEKLQSPTAKRQGVDHNLIGSKKSGTDSDGDSGIGHMTSSQESASSDEAVATKKQSSISSLAPKLKKYRSTNKEIAKINHVTSSQMSAQKEAEIERKKSQSDSLKETQSNHPEGHNLIKDEVTQQINNQSDKLMKNDFNDDSQPGVNPISDNTSEDSSNDINSLSVRSSTASILKTPSQNIPLETSSSRLQKTVRFNSSDEIVDDDTPRLAELKRLAEAAVVTPRISWYKSVLSDMLPETSLNDRFDTDSSDLSSEETSNSSPDLAGLDPRLAQFAAGVKNYSISFKKSQQLNNKLENIVTRSSKSDLSTKVDSQESVVSSDDNSFKVKRDKQCTSKVANDNEDSNTTVDDNQNNHSTDDGSHHAITHAVVGPPKPPRLSSSSAESSPDRILPKQHAEPAASSACNTKATAGSPRNIDSVDESLHIDITNRQLYSPDGLEESKEEVEPYAMVDASAFRHPTEETQSKPQTQKSKSAVSSKPPLPKSSPPKCSNQRSLPPTGAQADRKTAALPATRDDLDLQLETESKHFNMDTSRQRHPGGMHSSWSSFPVSSSELLNEDIKDNVSVKSSSSQTSKASHSSRSRTLRGRAPSLDDLWGSNASVNEANQLKSSNLSTSRSSVFGRVGSFGKAAKQKIKALKRSLSLERLSTSSPEKPPSSKTSNSDLSSQDKKVPPMKKSLSSKHLHLSFGKKSSYNVDSNTGALISRKLSNSSLSTPISSEVDFPNHFRPIGKLLELCPDGTQVVQLNRPPHGPYGFYVGQGRRGNKQGVFVTRLSDSYAEKLFSGLLAVDDEIVEINGQTVQNLAMNDVYDLFSSSDKLILKLVPVSAKKSDWSQH